MPNPRLLACLPSSGLAGGVRISRGHQRGPHRVGEPGTEGGRRGDTEHEAPAAQWHPSSHPWSMVYRAPFVAAGYRSMVGDGYCDRNELIGWRRFIFGVFLQCLHHLASNLFFWSESS